MMAEDTKITWCDATFNPWIGCSKVHAGCANCYAEADFDKRRHHAQWGPNGTRVLTSATNWKKPLAWNRAALWRCRDCGFSGPVAPTADPEFICCGNCGCQVNVPRQRVFCASLADVFEQWDGPVIRHGSGAGEQLWRCPDDCHWFADSEGDCTYCDTRMRPAALADVRKELFGLIDETPNLDWLLLTKRPENIRRMVPYRECTTCDGSGEVPDWNGDPVSGTACGSPCPECEVINMQYRENVWLGTSVSDQETADRAVPELLKCRELAPVLFLSVEPLLGPVDLSEWLQEPCPDCDGSGNLGRIVDPGFAYPPNSTGRIATCELCGGTSERDGRGFVYRPAIDWVIVGGESGPNARPCDIAWIESIVAQCEAAGVPCFAKQLGANSIAWTETANLGVPELLHPKWVDPKGGDPSEWPESLRVQQFPDVAP